MDVSTNTSDDWVCGICLEEDTRPRTLHECGKHEFHRVCLAPVRDSRCPICRFQDPSLTQAHTRHPIGNTLLQVERGRNIPNFGCAYCDSAIPMNAECVAIIPCQDTLHPICAISVMQRFGITPRGLLYCPRCSQRQ
jgi:hypothetical protein